MVDGVRGTKEYRERNAGRTKNYRARQRQQVFDHYGNQCACCGETEVAFLNLDHTFGGGNDHWRKLKEKGHANMYAWIIANNFPEGFRILCSNCNCAMSRLGYCPHGKLPDVLIHRHIAGHKGYDVGIVDYPASPAKPRGEHYCTICNKSSDTH